MARDVGPGEEIRPGEAIEFDYIVPDAGGIRGEQIAASLALGLPEANVRQHLTVFATGPSAKGATTPYGKSIALNGALDDCVKRGHVPDFYACCDPQEIVADFLDPDHPGGCHPPEETIYFVASKCHPKVFERLKGTDVRIWHPKDFDLPGRLRTPLCSSITLSALWLMTRQGFTDFDVWGWDACYLDGEHHFGEAAPAYAEQPNFVRLNYGGTVTDGEVIGGRTFDTTRTWAAEASGAEQFFQLADYLDLTINIHGDGMIKAVRQNILGD